APRAQCSVGTDHGNFRAVRGFKSTRFTSSMSKCQAKMPRYSFHIENGFAEDHALELANDSELYFPRTTVRPKRDVVPIAARPFPAQDRVSGEALAGLDRRVTGRVMIAHPSRLL